MKLTGEFVLSKTHCESLGNVRRINLWGEKLSDVSIVSQMPNLEIASLSVNSISSIASFSSCRKLRELYVRKNNIADLSEIRHLRQLADFRVLWLSENPCAVGDPYRLTVIRNLPNLEILDNVRVTDEERRAASDISLYEQPSFADVVIEATAVKEPEATHQSDRLVVNGNSPRHSSNSYDKRRYEEAETDTAKPEVLRISRAASNASPLHETNVQDANEQPIENAGSNDEEVDVGAYWETVASVADQILARQSPTAEEDELGGATQQHGGARSGSNARRRRTRRAGAARSTDEQSSVSPRRPTTRKGVRSRRDAKLVDAIVSLVEIVDDGAALERIRDAIQSRLETMTLDVHGHGRDPSNDERSAKRDFLAEPERDTNELNTESRDLRASEYV